jgi:beta-lactamase class A
MTHMTRRHLLGGVAAAGIVGAFEGPNIPLAFATAADDPALSELEAAYGRRLGVFACNLDDGEIITHRPDERFPILSVFKTLLGALVLRDCPPQFQSRRVTWMPSDVVENSPVTSVTIRNGLTVAQLCEAAITRSDNTAANVLLRELGGPHVITGFARSLGDHLTRLDRWEPALNEATPGDERDTTSPRAIGDLYAALIVGRALPRRDQQLLLTWLLANQTTTTRFGAGVPTGWQLADKTGGGAYGSRNDVGVTWTPAGAPILIAALSVGDKPTDDGADDLLRDVANQVTNRLAQ